MKTYPSISDFLEAHGYVAMEDGYHRDEGGGMKSCIPPGEWQGLTVEAFIQKARKLGWVTDEEELRVLVSPPGPEGERVTEVEGLRKAGITSVSYQGHHLKLGDFGWEYDGEGKDD